MSAWSLLFALLWVPPLGPGLGSAAPGGGCLDWAVDHTHQGLSLTLLWILLNLDLLDLATLWTSSSPPQGQGREPQVYLVLVYYQLFFSSFVHKIAKILKTSK